MSTYLTDEEYQNYWIQLGGIRRAISENLQLDVGMRILDVGTGYGFFAIEMARLLRKGTIIGIDIVDSGIEKAKKLVKEADVDDIVSIEKMDATELSFPESYFDLATSFLGMRDVYMTRGRRGVEKTVEEMIRVVKSSGKIVLCTTPPEDMETEDLKIAVKLEGEIFGAKSLPKKFYMDIFKKNNVAWLGTKAFYTRRKMTAAQTQTEFKDGIEIATKIYGRKVPSFSEVWSKYGRKIEASGYGMYSKIVVMTAQKLE